MRNLSDFFLLSGKPLSDYTLEETLELEKSLSDFISFLQEETRQTSELLQKVYLRLGDFDG